MPAMMNSEEIEQYEKEMQPLKYRCKTVLTFDEEDVKREQIFDHWRFLPKWHPRFDEMSTEEKEDYEKAMKENFS